MRHDMAGLPAAPEDDRAHRHGADMLTQKIAVRPTLAIPTAPLSMSERTGASVTPRTRNGCVRAGCRCASRQFRRSRSTSTRSNRRQVLPCAPVRPAETPKRRHAAGRSARHALPGSGPGRAAARPCPQPKAPGPIAPATSRRPSPCRYRARPRPMVRRLHRRTFLSRNRCAHRRRATWSTGPNPAGEFLSSPPFALRQAQAVVPGDRVLFGVEKRQRHVHAAIEQHCLGANIIALAHDRGEMAAGAVAVSEPGTET